MLDKLISIRETLRPSETEVFAVLNTTMDQAQAVDLLLSVFDYERCEALAGALVAEIKRRKALEKDAKARVSSVRREVGKNAN